MALGLTQPLTNEYQEYFLEGKGGQCIGLTTLLPSFVDCLKSGSLNLLEHSGPVQACNGIALLSPNYVEGNSRGIVSRAFMYENRSFKG